MLNAIIDPANGLVTITNTANLLVSEKYIYSSQIRDGNNFFGTSSVRAIRQVWQRLVLLGGAGRLAFDLPALPCVQTVPVKYFLCALNIVFDVIVQQICW